MITGEIKVSTSTVAALFSKMALTGQRIAMEDTVLLVFLQHCHIYRKGGWGQSSPLKIFFSCSLGGGGRYFSVLCDNFKPNFKNEKSAQRVSFGDGCPADIRGRAGKNPGKKNKHLGVDIHDPKAGTSTTLRDFQKLRSVLDEGQITHLICARLKYDLYDFFRGCFGPASCSFSCRKGPKAPP